MSPPAPRQSAFRKVPWRWGDLLIGLAPILAGRAIPSLLSEAVLASAPRQTWVVATGLAMVWMLAYPLWVARRRERLPRLSKPRVILVEALLALVAAPALMLLLTGAPLVLARVLDVGAPSSDPFGPIARSSDPFAWPALVVLAVAAAPLAEEVFFRGMIYNALRRRMHPALAALLQAIGFGLLHPFGFAGQALVAVSGLSFAALYEWRKTLVAPVLLHALLNAASMAVLWAGLAAEANAPVLGVLASPHEDGCFITTISPGTGADEAGLRAGDVIVQLEGEPVADQSGLARMVRTRRVGDEVQVVFLRDGEAYRVSVKLKARPR